MKPARRRHRSLGGVAVLALLAAIIWTTGLISFAAVIPLSVDDPETKTDAIVVLTGGSGRLDAGFRLLRDDKAANLFISGVYRGIEVRHLLDTFKEDPLGLENRVHLGTAANTAGNADETAVWMVRNGVSSLRLVTAAYHMPRSLLEFRRALPDGAIVPHPVFPPHVKQDRWWAFPGTTGLTIAEYHKFVGAWLRIALERAVRSLAVMLRGVGEADAS